MERLNPLSDALAEVASGRLDVRVEEGGSRDFVQIFRGFNRMAMSLTETLTDLDVRNRDLAEMNRATSRFVPFQFLELLDKRTIREIERGDQIQLDISILFADIRGFTTMAEQVGPAATFSFINRYLGHMGGEIRRERGFINEFLGDGIMALFHQGADAALQAALGMVTVLDRFNGILVAEGQGPIRVGIGVNSGPLMLGTIGGERRLSGDPANTAARVEGMTKLYGAALLISQGTHERLADRPATPSARSTGSWPRVRTSRSRSTRCSMVTRPRRGIRSWPRRRSSRRPWPTTARELSMPLSRASRPASRRRLRTPARRYTSSAARSSSPKGHRPTGTVSPGCDPSEPAALSGLGPGPVR